MTSQIAARSATLTYFHFEEKYLDAMLTSNISIRSDLQTFPFSNKQTSFLTPLSETPMRFDALPSRGGNGTWVL
jgi:hypothetical protein